MILMTYNCICIEQSTSQARPSQSYLQLACLHADKPLHHAATHKPSGSSRTAGTERLCEQFWEDGALVVPVKRFLDDARDLYPAVTAPFLQLLSALATGEAAATAAAGYLDQLPRLACIHTSSGETHSCLRNTDCYLLRVVVTCVQRVCW